MIDCRLGRELGKNLNTDESAAMGAVYKAADLSSGFKVKKFITKVREYNIDLYSIDLFCLGVDHVHLLLNLSIFFSRDLSMDI